SATDHSKSSAARVAITSTVTGTTITQLPPEAFPLGATLNVAATVDGDPSSAGVDWKATCNGLNCTGGFNGLTHQEPLFATTFTIPSDPALVDATVTLTAASTADRNFTDSATFVVSAPISMDITQPPPTTVLANSSVPVAATTSNDPTDSGVIWTI